MGLLFKIISKILVPLLLLGFVRSFLRDFLRMAQQGGTRCDWQRQTGTGQSAGENARTFRDAYDVLGLPRTASDDEIRSRYRELISKYHPDKFAGLGDPEFTRLAAEKFQQVQGAYEELKRRRGF